jgi:hypothetical protein
VNIVLSILRDLISIIGPNTKKLIIAPRLKVFAKESAKKASTEEQIDIKNAKNIKASTDNVGD